MEAHQYILIESTYIVNGIEHTIYGIALVEAADEVILKTVPDLSCDKERVSRFAELCTRLQLSPLHLTDVIEDFLTE